MKKLAIIAALCGLASAADGQMLQAITNAPQTGPVACTYTTNFDSDTPLVIAPNFANIAGAWFVYTINPISAPQSFGSLGPGSNNDTSVASGLSATADHQIYYLQKMVNVTNGDNVSPIVRSNSAGSNLYLFDLSNNGAGTLRVFMFKKVAGSFTLLDTSGTLLSGLSNGDTLGIRAQVQGSTLSLRIWNATAGAEPGSWSYTFSDSAVTAAGYVGLYNSYGAGDGQDRAADDFCYTAL